MAQQKLNLFQLASPRMAQPGTASPKIMWRQLVDSHFLGELLHDVPNDLVRHSLSPDSPCLTHAAKQLPVADTSGCEPIIYYLLDPSGKWDGANVASLPEKVHDCPVLFALL